MNAQSIRSCSRSVALFLFSLCLVLTTGSARAQAAPLTIKCPTNLVLWTCDSNVVFQYPMPRVTGGCPPYVGTCAPPPGTAFPVGTSAVTCQVSDQCDNRDSCTFTVTVRKDSAPPVIECPSNLVVHACPTSTGVCGATVTYPAPKATDDSGSVAVTCTPPSGTFLPCGIHVVVCTAEDRCGNKDLCRFTITVLEGGQPPRILCPSNIVVWTCGTNGVVVNYPPPTVFNGSDPSPTVSCLPPSGSTFPIGTTVVICRVQDDCGNESKCEFAVTVRRDTTPPLLHCPSNIVVCVSNRAAATVHYVVTATDDCDPAPTIDCQPPSGSVFPLGKTIVVCRAEDQCGNESRCDFSVLVLLDGPPKLTILKEPGHVIVCWTKTCQCYKLQATRSLNRSILWVDVPDEPLDLGDRYCVRVPLAGGMRYFRLVACDQPLAPVYDVGSAGLTPSDARRLAAALNLPADQTSLQDGALLFLDPRRFQAIPMEPIQDPAIIDQLARGSENDKGELTFDAINFGKLREIRPIDGNVAIDLFEHALRGADLLPENAEPEATHSMFEAVDERGQPMVEAAAIDTHVNYHFHLGGFPLIGPGAKLSLALSPEGKPTALLFAARKLTLAQDVPVIPVEEAARRCAALYPHLQPSARPRLVYFAPALSLSSVRKLIPCYECGGEALVDGQPVSLLHSLIPATDDPALVAKVGLDVVAQGTLVRARTTVEGGTPPYTYEWLSSSTDLGSFSPGASSIEYEATPRAGVTEEMVHVIVTDANGVQVQASQTVAITPGAIGGIVFLPAVGGVTDYGCERAVSNMGAGNQSGFVNRFDSEGVARRFNWSGVNAWERDFKEGPTGLDSTYVDNADIVFYIGHGNGGGFTFESNHDDGTLSYTDAAGAWGDLDLEWLALLSCQVLKHDYNGQTWSQRWGPSFDGLHLLLGFETNAHDWPAFGGTFADWALGRHWSFFTLPAMPVRSSWFLAKWEQQPAADIAVAMGVIGPAGCSNYDDYFWGKGPVGPDIRGANIHGYWRVTYQ